MSPPFRVVRNGELPPLDEADDSFDLIYAVSVFSHLTDEWPGWLSELHRLLKDDGILIATFLGRGFWNLGLAGRAGIPFDQDRMGMHIEHYGSNFADGWGPAVFLSEWWIREHWGRAFAILAFEPYGFAVREDGIEVNGQGCVVMRPKPVRVTPNTLSAPGPEDHREVDAERYSRELTQHVSSVAEERRGLPVKARLRRAAATIHSRIKSRR